MSLLVLPVGLLIGLSLGALGGGGSILTVPALVYLLDQDPRHATTGSLLIVAATSLIALVPHARRGNVRFGQGLTFGALGTAGSFAGSLASARVAPWGTGSAAGAPLIALRPFHGDWPRVAKIVAAATVVGLLTGFLGVGGGFALVPVLILVLTYPMPTAVGTSLLVIAVNSATAMVTRAGDTDLDWTVIGTFTAAAIAGSLLGGRIAARARPHVLIRAFALLLVAVAVYTGIRSLAVLL